jgi:MOSC domain-containing protein YiiM
LEYIGKVVKLFINKKEINNINCDVYGIIGDKFYKKDKNRSILLSSLDSYNLAKENNINISYGMLGENILLDFNPYELEIGTTLIVGGIKLKISQECTICNNLSAIDNKLPKLLKKDRGIFVYALSTGIINKNDKVYLEKI